MHLLQAECMVIDTEQGQGDERRRRDRRNPIDALEDLEDDFIEGPPERLIVPARTSLAQREGFPEPHVGLAERPALRPRSRRASARPPSPWRRRPPRPPASPLPATGHRLSTRERAGCPRRRRCPSPRRDI